MPILRIMGFDGIVPRTSPTVLSDSQAQQADNVKLYSRELRYWRGSTKAYTPSTPNVKTIWRYYTSASTYWLTWGTDVDVVTSPQADVSDYRLYYTDGTTPKKTNEALATTGTGDYPRAWRYMGVPAPTAAPTVARVGSGTSPENRVYIYTNVSTFGSLKEESAPSPASASVLCGTGDSITINGFAAAPTTGYNITHRRIYRSVTGSSTVSYQLVAEIAVGTTSYSDTLTAAQLGEIIGTIGWAEPPVGLQGLVALPGGSLAGFVGNTVYFSQPYAPHAWPLAYALTMPHKVVALGIFGSSVAVMTDRYPHIISGGVPGQMQVERVPLLEPCLSKSSVTNSLDGVVYSSPNGLVAIGYNTRARITDSLFRRDEWQAVAPATYKAVTYDGRYVALYPNEPFKSFLLSSDDIPALSNLSVWATAAHVDSSTGQMFYVNSFDNCIYQADADDLNPIFYAWRSKRFVLPRGTTFSALKLDANFNQATLAAAYQAQTAAIAASNATLFPTDLMGTLNSTPLNKYTVNGSKLTDIPSLASSRSAQVQLFGDGSLKASLTIKNWSPYRIPAFRCRELEIKITGNLDVRALSIATSQVELEQ